MLNRLTFALMLIAISVAPTSAAPSDPSDEVMVRQTIQTYLHGLKFNDIESFKKAFYPDARLFFVKKNGTIGQLTQAEWYAGFTANAGKEEKGDLQIASLDVSGSAASAKVEEEYPDSHYTDYISLLKLNGEWKIVNKIFYSKSKRQ